MMDCSAMIAVYPVNALRRSSYKAATATLSLTNQSWAMVDSCSNSCGASGFIGGGVSISVSMGIAFGRESAIAAGQSSGGSGYSPSPSYGWHRPVHHPKRASDVGICKQHPHVAILALMTNVVSHIVPQMNELALGHTGHV